MYLVGINVLGSLWNVRSLSLYRQRLAEPLLVLGGDGMWPGIVKGGLPTTGTV